MPRLLALYRDAFRGLSREVWLLSLFLFVNRCGTMVLTFLVLYLTERRGFSDTSAGALLGAYGVGGALGMMVGGWLVDRVGFLPVQVGCQVLGGIGFLLFPLLDTTASLALGTFALGVVSEGFRPANGAAVAAFSRPENRSRAYGLNRLALNLGMAVGPALGGVLASRDYHLLFHVDGATCLVAAACLALFLPWRAPEEPAAPGAPGASAPGDGSPWRDRRFLAVFALLFVLGLVFFQVISTYPLHLDRVGGFSKVFIGRALALNAVLIVLFEMPLVKAVEGREPLRLLALAAVLVGLGFGLLPLFDGAAWVLALVVVWTVGEMLMAPTSMAWVANRAGARRRGAYMAAFGISFSAPYAVAPLVGTATFEHLGPDVLWAGCVALGLLGCLGFRALAARRDGSTPALF